MERGAIVEFRQIFPGEKPDPESWLKGWTEKEFMLVGPTLVSYDFKDDIKSNPASVFSHFLGHSHQALPQILYSYGKLSRTQPDTSWKVINPITSLKLTQRVRKHQPSGTDASSEEKNLNLLKYYLYLNQEVVSLFDPIVLRSTKYLEPRLKGPAMNLLISLRDNDITNYNKHKIFGAGLIKAVAFLEFAEKDAFLSSYLNQLIESKGQDNWKSYLLKVIGIVRFTLNKINGAYSRIEITENHENIPQFDDYNYEVQEEADIDFIDLRSRPLVRDSDTSYVIISELFLVEKIFKGLFWQFRPLIGNKEFSTLKQKFSFDFAEKVLSYKVLNEVFRKNTNFTGDQISASKISGFVDFYSRSGNSIFLFESKDVVLNKEIKHSGDWIVVEAALRDKFYVKDDGSRSAILQLLNSIRIILSRDFALDYELPNNKDLVIYPVILVHDHLFNLAGLNNILNQWMSEQVGADPDLLKIKNRIKGVTLMDIDTLIFNNDILETHPDLIIHSVEKMHSDFRYYNTDLVQEKSEESVYKSLDPFSVYLEDAIPENVKRSPKEFIDTAMRLFQE